MLICFSGEDSFQFSGKDTCCIRVSIRQDTFSDDRILGCGAFGNVYKGTFEVEGTARAIKRSAHAESYQSTEEFRNGDGFEAKVSDFGLVKMGPIGDQSLVSSQIKGTPGYLDPAYCSSFHSSPLVMYTALESYSCSFSLPALQLI
ncbi:hypothetical protein OIU77_019137 [Salix suchowensis]|uniref:non-specific serine/threonine protein kinase n=1 Tax=Salix suchowensis TaxID=1278906 RepID=A0ABQ9CF21_9ROSI|nr:hypothetical protein OIU77_019137 [Salix suchowensis]